MSQPVRTVKGYWGNDLRCRISQEMTFEKQRALLEDQLVGGGLRSFLWLAVHDERQGEVASPGTLRCSCVKKSQDGADRRCNSCYGIAYIPGYRKFGYETIWVASISPNLTLANLVLNTDIKPHRLELDPVATSGTMETPDIFFSRSVTNLIWEARSDFVLRDGANSSVVTEFSLDGGATWISLDDLAATNPASGRIRFRVTISRVSTAIPTPLWEVLRARFPTIPIAGRIGPWILMLKTVSPDKKTQDVRGILTTSDGDRFWTAPLSLFDCQIQSQQGLGAALDPNNLIRDQAFIQFLEGARRVNFNQRWSITNMSYSDPFGYLVRQFFDARLQQEQEYTSLVF